MVDTLGLSIFLLGVLLIVLELSLPGYFIGVGGTALIVLGLIQMAYTGFLVSWWSPFVVAVVVPAAAYVSVQFYRKLAPPDSRPETYSSDRLLGEEGKVVVDVTTTDTKGKVKVGGIVWSAEANEPIPAGQRVRVTRIEGVHLVVERVTITAPATEPLPSESGTHGD